MTAQTFANHLQASQDKWGEWRAHCPGHADTLPSLFIREDSAGRVQIRCLAGCKRRDILRALGLSRQSLLASSPVSAKQSASIRAFRKSRAIIERSWRRERRKLWDRVRTMEAVVEDLRKKLLRSPDNDELTRLFNEASKHLHDAEWIATSFDNPFNRREWAEKISRIGTATAPPSPLETGGTRKERVPPDGVAALDATVITGIGPALLLLSQERQ